ncbi:hypothetical protein NGUA41_02672 [Salmonella enterica]|nr:hypothetical protein NGUA41_02672 [Salmonella enterica]
MLAQGALCKDATSRPARKPEGISGGDHEVAIFPPGAGIVKGAAIAPLTRSLAFSVQRSDEHEVNGTLSQREHVHYPANTC